MTDQDAPMQPTPKKGSFSSPTCVTAPSAFPLTLDIASPIRVQSSPNIPTSPINRAPDGECSDASLPQPGLDADSSNRDACNDSSGTSFNKSTILNSLGYISESQPRLGCMSAQIWEESDEEIAQLEHHIDRDNLQLLYIMYRQRRTLFLLPCRAMVYQDGQQVARLADHWQIKLPMATTSLQYEANGASAPLSASALQKSLPSAFLCNVCLTAIAETESIARYLPLPSQHWEELIDAWMCHSDQEINQGMIDTQKQLDEHRGLQRGQGRVSDAMVVLHPSHLAKDAAVKNDVNHVSSELCRPIIPGLA